MNAAQTLEQAFRWILTNQIPWTALNKQTGQQEERKWQSSLPLDGTIKVRTALNEEKRYSLKAVYGSFAENNGVTVRFEDVLAAAKESGLYQEFDDTRWIGNRRIPSKKLVMVALKGQGPATSKAPTTKRPSAAEIGFAPTTPATSTNIGF